MRSLSETIGKKAVLIPSSDQFVSAIAKYAGILRRDYLFSSGIGLQGLLSEKETQYQLTLQHDMPMPLTSFAHSTDEVIDFGQKSNFPCLIKPKHYRQWRKFPKGHPLHGMKIAVAESKRELLEKYHLASEVDPFVILQEIIEGPDTAKRVYLSCYNESGDRIAQAMFRELRCKPVGFGPATVSEPIIDPETDRICNLFFVA